MRSLLFLLCVLLYYSVYANIEPVSFGIVTSSDLDHESTPITLTLYWNKSFYQCIIEASAFNHLYECETSESKNRIISDTLSVNRMHILSAKHISIQSVIMWDNNGNYHEINSFCGINHINDECHHSASVLSAIIHFPPNDVLLRSPNELHQGFIHQQRSLRRQLLIETGNNSFDIDYFEFTLSDAPESGIDEFAFEAIVFWRQYKFSCAYNSDNNPVLAGQTVVCNDTNALFLAGDISLNDSFKFELRYVGLHNDTMRIDSLRVYTVNGAYFEMNEFCVPFVFNVSQHIHAMTRCALYPHKYSLSNLPIDREFVPRLYVHFRDEISDNFSIASYANQAFAGNIRLLEPTQIIVKLNKTANSSKNAGIDYALYWDEYIINCKDVGATDTLSYCKMKTATKSIECNHETQFMLRIHNKGANGTDTDTIIIESITVQDDHTGYRVDNFCVSNTFAGNKQAIANCTHAAYSTIPKWKQICVGDQPNYCSDTSINIQFPADFLLYNNIQFGSRLLEGFVENKTAPIAATCSPTKAPTDAPTNDPTNDPTEEPTIDPTNDPSYKPTADPTVVPTNNPTQMPTMDPTIDPTNNTTYVITKDTYDPTVDPTLNPTFNPTFNPSFIPTKDPISKITTTEYDKDEGDTLGSASAAFDDMFVTWFNANTTNKIISCVAVAVFILICCLICYICYIRKSCCFKKKTNIDDKPLNSSAASLKSNSIQLVSVQSPPSSSIPYASSSMRKVSSIAAPLHDEYIVQFRSKPFGMNWSTLKTDRYNLYVSKIEANSIAAQNRIKVGDKLVALNGDSIEGIGSKKIYEEIAAAGLPISIMFRKRNKRQKSLRAQIVASESGEGSLIAYDPLDAQSPFSGENHQRLSQIQEAVKIVAVSQIDLDEVSSSSGNSADLMYDKTEICIAGNTPIQPAADILQKMSTVMNNSENIPNDDD